MKTLMLLRHGKSDWSADVGSDHDRVLAPRGVKSARLVGRTLTDTELTPDRVVSSSAVRALTTAELAAEAGGWKCPMQVTRDLYGTTVSGALDVVRRQDGEPAERILMVGHEPTWSSLTSSLIGGGRVPVVTAALVVIDLGVDRWAEVEPGRGELRLLVPPRWLKKARS